MNDSDIIVIVNNMNNAFLFFRKHFPVYISNLQYSGDRIMEILKLKLMRIKLSFAQFNMKP